MTTLELWIPFFILFSSPNAHAAEPAFPPPAQRGAMLRAVAAEMERLDGEALLVRSRNRARAFGAVVDHLTREASDASSWPELLRAFARLDASYPNLHSRFRAGTWLSPAPRKRLSVGLAAEWLAGGSDLRVSRASGLLDDDRAPRAGDRVVAIQGEPLVRWQEENLEFCKFPLRGQCDLELPANLSRGLLAGWRGDAPLGLTLERAGRRWDVLVPLEGAPDSPEFENGCAKDHELYPDFEVVHEGRNACLYRLRSNPGIVLLRIASFQYDPARSSSPIRSVDEEVEALWGWWKVHAPRISRLLIDVAGNHGGDVPIPYYQLLYERPFQELHARFRKISEMEKELFRKEGLFWGTPGQEAWFQSIRREGTWDRTPWGALLPAVPMFCAGEKDCRNGLFPVRPNGFRGKISLVVNAWCVSSCDGFVFSLKETLGNRVSVVGQPQSGDSAYSRVRIRLFLDPRDPRGFRTSVATIFDDSAAEDLLSQTVSVTRSVRASGEILSGLPTAVDFFVPRTFEQGERAWRRAAVQAALAMGAAD